MAGSYGISDSPIGMPAPAAKEAEAGGDVPRGEVAGWCCRRGTDDQHDDADDDDLPDDGAEGRVRPVRTASPASARCALRPGADRRWLLTWSSQWLHVGRRPCPAATMQATCYDHCGHAIGRRNGLHFPQCSTTEQRNGPPGFPTARMSTARTRPIRLDQRIGGAYCRPPLVHMLLIPRGTPIGVMSRSHILAEVADLLDRRCRPTCCRARAPCPCRPQRRAGGGCPGRSLFSMSSTFLLVTPFSSAVIIAMKVQRTRSNHLSSPLRTIDAERLLADDVRQQHEVVGLRPWLKRNVASAERRSSRHRSGRTGRRPGSR